MFKSEADAEKALMALISAYVVDINDLTEASLSEVDEKVDLKFDKFVERVVNTRTRKAAETQLINPSMASTDLKVAAGSADAKAYEARAAAFRALSSALAKYIAYRAFAEEAKHKWESFEQDRISKESQAAVGLYDEAKDFVDFLFRHGVHKWHLRQPSAEAKAIFADLILWYCEDTQFADPDSPWPGVMALYEQRTLRKPDSRMFDEHRSKPGPAPIHTDRRTPDRYYRFSSSLMPAIESAAEKEAEDAVGTRPVKMDGAGGAVEAETEMPLPSRQISNGPLASWRDLPTTFSGLQLKEASAHPAMVAPLPPSTDIAHFTPDGKRPEFQETRLATYEVWADIISAWRARQGMAPNEMQAAVWAILLAHRLSPDDSDVSGCYRLYVRSPWDDEGIVRIQPAQLI